MASASYYHENYPFPPPLVQLATYSEMQTFEPMNSRMNTYMPTPQQKYTPLQPTTSYHSKPTSSAQPPRVSRKRFELLKRSLRVIRLITTLVSTFLNAVMFCLMAYVNIKFYSTRSHVSQELRAWPARVKQWPSIMLLVAALVTLFVSIVLLLVNCCKNYWRSKQAGVGQKEKMADGSWKVTLLKYTVQICIWAVVSISYRYEKSLHGNDNDLWGWSCANKSNAVQAAFHGKIDFSGLCNMQGRSWNLSIAEPILKLIFAVVHFWLRRKIQGEKQNFADHAGGAAVDLLQNVF